MSEARGTRIILWNKNVTAVPAKRFRNTVFSVSDLLTDPDFSIFGKAIFRKQVLSRRQFS